MDVYEVIGQAAKTGKIDKGINEVTKAVERGTAKLVVVASDVNPKELVQHIPILCKEKEIKFVEADSKDKLGISAGLGVGTSAVAVITPGDAKIDSLN
jgi:large subunit ribosomal protein L7Ae